MESKTQYLNNQFSLENKIAVITGGTGVLASEMVRTLALAGANVVVLARRKELAEETARKVEKESGKKAIAVVADVTDRSSLEAAYAEVLKTFGRVDILVNAAGGNMPGAVVMPDQNFFDLNYQDTQKVIDLNLGGSILPTLVFCKGWVQSKQGVVVNISSMSAIRAITRVMGYSVAKGAIDTFTQWLSVEMATKYGEGIRVNAIAPGFFVTEQNRRLLTNVDGSLTDRGQKVINNTPMKRFGEANDLSGALVWLCSDSAKFVTGIVVCVDGGFSSFSGV